jgi:ABC-2 type transport system permease protein
MHRRATVLWGLAFAFVVYGSAAGYAAAYGTASSRHALASSLGHNAGLAALFGTPHDLASVSGFTAWRSAGVLFIAGAIWGLLLGTTASRGEEEAGRWELVAAAATSRARATAATACGLAVSAAVLWAFTAFGTLAAGRVRGADQAIGPALRLAGVLVAPVALFAAVGLLSSQLLASRRAAATLAGAVFGACYLLRMAAAAGDAPAWLHGLSVIGWFDNAAAGSAGWLAAGLGLAAGLAVVATLLTQRRDLGDALLRLPNRRRAARGPRSSLALALRLSAPPALGWLAGTATVAFVVAILARTVGGSLYASPSAHDLLARITGSRHSGALTFLGMAMLTVSTLLALCAASQAAALRIEEDSGLIEPVLSMPVALVRWFVERCAVVVAVLAAQGLTIGLMLWAGSAAAGTDVAGSRLLAAGLNVVPYATAVFALGMLAFSFVPRLTATVAFGAVAWSFLLELVGALVRAPHWLLDLSLLHHLALLPAASANWIATATFVAIAATSLGVGAARFARRDTGIR